jgi:hypothetical protein
VWFLALTFALFELIRLRIFPDPTGADGYFYLKQIQSISESATFYYKDYSLAFLPLSLLNFFLHDPLLTYQFALCFTLAASGWMVYRLALFLSGPQSSRPVKIIASTMTLAMMASSVALDLHFVFLKTAFATIFLLVALECALREKWKTACAFAAAALFSHKAMSIYIPIFLLSYFFEHGAQRPKKLDLKICAVAIATILVVGLCATALNAGLFGHLKSLLLSFLIPADFSKFSTESVTLHPYESLALFISFVAASIALTAFSQHWVLVGSGIVMLLPLFAPGAIRLQDLSYRLLIVAWPFVTIVITKALILALSSPQDAPSLKGRVWRLASAICAALLITGSVLHHPSMSNWVIPWSKRLPQSEELSKNVPRDALVYAPHGVEFYLAYKTPFRPRSFIIDPKGRATYRVAFVGPYLSDDDAALRDDIEQMAVAQLGPSFRVFREDDWQALGSLHPMAPLSLNVLDRKPDFVPDY